MAPSLYVVSSVQPHLAADRLADRDRTELDRDRGSVLGDASDLVTEGDVGKIAVCTNQVQV